MVETNILLTLATPVWQ